MKTNRTLFIMLLLTTILWSCENHSVDLEIGTLEGKVSIGPLCPVETDPPQPECQATLETYKAWPIAIYRASDSTKVMNINPDALGLYRIDLPVDSYIVDLENEHHFGDNLPTKVEINPGEILVLDIDIDTGIR